MDDFSVIQTDEGQNSRLLGFFQDALRPTSWFYIAWLMVVLFMSFTVYGVWSSMPLRSVIPATVVFYIVLLVHIGFRIRSGGKANILAPDVLFVLVYALFHMGYITFYSVGIVPYLTEVFHFRASIPKALLVVNIGLVGFLFGYEIIGGRGSAGVVEEDIQVPNRTWCTVALVLMVIALAMHLISLSFIGGELLARYGYKAIIWARRYTSYWVSLFLWGSDRLMVFALITYTISSALRYGKLFHSKLALGFTVTFCLITMLEGARTPMAMLIMPVLLVRHYFVRRIRIRYLIVLLWVALTVFAAMAMVRNIAGLAPRKMFAEYQYQKGKLDVTWWGPVVSFGSSFLPVNITCHEVPSTEAYWRGASWCTASTHIVPFLQGYLARHGFAGTYGWIRWAPSTWVTTTYFGEEASGRGFTVSAEGYLNFGFLGAFVEPMLFGLFFRWLSVKFSRRQSAKWGLIMLGCMCASFTVARNHLNIVTNVCAQVAVLALLLNFFLGNERTYETEPFPYLYE